MNGTLLLEPPGGLPKRLGRGEVVNGEAPDSEYKPAYQAFKDFSAKWADELTYNLIWGTMSMPVPGEQFIKVTL